VPLKLRTPWDQAESEALIDHREAAGGKIQAPTVYARDGLAFRGWMTWQASNRTNPRRCRLQLASAQGVEEVASEVDALALALGEPLLDQVFDAGIHGVTDVASEAA
jgi:hypothetical protein